MGGVKKYVSLTKMQEDSSQWIDHFFDRLTANPMIPTLLRVFLASLVYLDD